MRIRRWLLVGTALLGMGFLFGRVGRPEAIADLTLWQSEDLPLANARVIVRCDGRRYALRSDEMGRVDIPGPCRSEPQVEGHGMVGWEKGKPLQFGPLGTLRLELRDRLGNLLPNVAADVTIHHGPSQALTLTTHEGVVEFRKVPLSLPARLIQVFPAAPWRFVSLQARREGDHVVYGAMLRTNVRAPIMGDAAGVLTNAHTPSSTATEQL